MAHREKLLGVARYANPQANRYQLQWEVYRTLWFQQGKEGDWEDRCPCSPNTVLGPEHYYALVSIVLRIKNRFIGEHPELFNFEHRHPELEKEIDVALASTSKLVYSEWDNFMLGYHVYFFYPEVTPRKQQWLAMKQMSKEKGLQWDENLYPNPGNTPGGDNGIPEAFTERLLEHVFSASAADIADEYFEDE